MLLQKFLFRNLKFFPLPSWQQQLPLCSYFSTANLKSNFLIPKPSEYLGKTPVYESLDDFDIIPPKTYREIIGEEIGLNREKRSCYVATEKNGQVYHLFDASRIPYGKMCQRIANLLQGKQKPTFKQNEASFSDTIVVVNATNLKLTGKKKLYKTVRYHTGFIGNLREIPIRNFIEEKPEQLITLCVSKMLPKNKLRRKWLLNLHVFRTQEHSFTQFLPNFVPVKLASQEYNVDFRKALQKDDETKIVYHSSEIPEEFKHLKVEEDPEITKSSKDQKLVVKMTKENREKLAQLKRREKIVKRYKEVVYKPPKNRDPRLDERPVLVTSLKQAEKFELTKDLVRDSGSEDEDEIMK